MNKENQITVLKFGSSVLRSDADLTLVVKEIVRWRRRGHRVVAVVSAIGNTTDVLTQRAHAISNRPVDSFIASLLATGETESAALLGIALTEAGIKSKVLDAVQAGLFTSGSTLDAALKDVKTSVILNALKTDVVVIPGFVGRNERNQTTLLGRGGSDLSALFIAHRLGAECRLIKDVDGLYTSDPNSTVDRVADRFERVSYESTLRIGGAVVQRKAVEFAQAQRLSFYISSLDSQLATEVGPFEDCIQEIEECAA